MIKDLKNNKRTNEQTPREQYPNENLDMDSLLVQMNISQKKMYQRLVNILPKMALEKENMIKELLILHILGFSEEKRIERLLTNLEIQEDRDIF